MQLEFLGINYSDILNATKTWFIESGPTVLAIIVGAFIISRFAGIFIEKIVRRVIIAGTSSKDDEKKREDTLIRIFDGTLRVVVWIITGMIILSELGVDIGPLIASAGVVGLAFGFGGQYLIKDIISGLFIILENQYRVGDAVLLNNVNGTVEDITLRTTIIRDMDGTVHFIPNGNIAQSANRSKGFSNINMNIGVGYDTDIKKLEKIIDRVGEELMKDELWADKLKTAPKFLRVESFGPSEIVVKILGTTKPKMQFEVAGELRRRLKETFDKEGIEIPFPQQVVHQAK